MYSSCGGLLEPSGEPVRKRPVRAEAVRHVVRGQRGEGSKGLDSQPYQQVGQLGPLEHAERVAREEVRRPCRTQSCGGPEKAGGPLPLGTGPRPQTIRKRATAQRP